MSPKKTEFTFTDVRRAYGYAFQYWRFRWRLRRGKPVLKVLDRPSGLSDLPQGEK